MKKKNLDQFSFQLIYVGDNAAKPGWALDEDTAFLKGAGVKL